MSRFQRKIPHTPETEEPETFTTADATAVLDAYQRYSRSMLRALLQASGLALLITLMFVALFTNVKLPSGIRYPSTGTMLSGFALLGLITTSLFVAARSPTLSVRDHIALGRRQFLSGLARSTTLISLAFGFYCALPALSHLNQSQGAEAFVGPVLGGLLLALFAADASGLAPGWWTRGYAAC